MTKRDRFGPDDEPPKTRRRIVHGPDLDRVVLEALDVLRDSDQVYRRAGRLVRLVKSETGELVIVDVGESDLRAELARLADWISVDQAGEEHPAAPQLAIVRAIRERRDFQGIRPLRGVVTAPALRPDGSIVDLPHRYDFRSGLFYGPSREYPPIPVSPTREDALRALAELAEPFADFPCQTDADRSALVALPLTLVGRDAIDGCIPMFVLEAAAPGTGKTLAAEVACLVANGHPAGAVATSDKDDEMRKALTSVARGGRRVVLFDNVAGRIGWPSLDAFLTSPTWEARLLGSNDLWSGPNLATVIATVNNASWGADTVRRTLRCRLVADVERPEERTGFRHGDLRAWARGEHPRLRVAALTVLRAFLAYLEGGGVRPKLRPWGSFDAWSALVRGALVWCGMADPADTLASLRELADPRGRTLAQLLEAWPDGERTAADLRALADDGRHPEFRAAVVDLAGGGKELPTARQLGNALAKVRERVMAGRRLQARVGHRGTLLWHVESIAAA